MIRMREPEVRRVKAEAPERREPEVQREQRDLQAKADKTPEPMPRFAWTAKPWIVQPSVRQDMTASSIALKELGARAFACLGDRMVEPAVLREAQARRDLPVKAEVPERRDRQARRDLRAREEVPEQPEAQEPRVQPEQRARQAREEVPEQPEARDLRAKADKTPEPMPRFANTSSVRSARLPVFMSATTLFGAVA
jgi:hypothetical protein